jgi:uncharacterized protein (DUF1501 family)
MKHINTSRREFLRASSALSVAGAASAPFALNLATMGSAAAQTATDYKALICLFMYGGNDSAHMVLPTDTDSWTKYLEARNQGADPIALRAPGTAPDAAAAAASPARLGGVLPINPNTAQAGRSFALHPLMTQARDLFEAGRLGIIANAGPMIVPTTKTNYNSVPRPRGLFSHNDQQSTWQAGVSEGARQGWGGKMADLMISQNTNAIFTSISTGGNHVFLSGRSVLQYQVGGNGAALNIAGRPPGTLFGSATAATAFQNMITDTGAANLFEKDYATVVKRSIDSQQLINSALTGLSATAVLAAPQYQDPLNNNALANNGLAQQLNSVLRLIAARDQLGVKRQVFLINIGGFDTHDGQNRGLASIYARISATLAYFDQAVRNINGVDLSNNVTMFTASDFGRTFTTNGDGTDHGWGAHHFVAGGAVKGKDIYGRFPTIGVSVNNGFQNPDALGSGNLIPGVAVDQYSATLARWFGVSDTDLDTLFPNLKNFNTANPGGGATGGRNMGFMNV